MAHKKRERLLILKMDFNLQISQRNKTNFFNQFSHIELISSKNCFILNCTKIQGASTA